MHLIFDYCDNEDLELFYALMRDRQKLISPITRIKFVRNMLLLLIPTNPFPKMIHLTRALHYLHTQQPKVRHGDVMPVSLCRTLLDLMSPELIFVRYLDSLHDYRGSLSTTRWIFTITMVRVKSHRGEP